MIKISVSRKESNSSNLEIFTKYVSIPNLSNILIFSSEVVDPLTENPSSKNEVAKGFPNQPQPKILTFFIPLKINYTLFNVR